MTNKETPTTITDGTVMVSQLVDTRQPEPEHVSTAALVSLAVGELRAVAKDRATDQGPKYQYRGIEDVLNALHPVLAKLGLTLQAITLNHHLDWRNANGKERRTCTLHVGFSLVGPDGIPHELGDWWGEGDAYDDKATNKAYSAALKLCLLQVFTIPTVDAEDTEAGANETVDYVPAAPDGPKVERATSGQVARVKELAKELTRHADGWDQWNDTAESDAYSTEWRAKALSVDTAQAAIGKLEELTRSASSQPTPKPELIEDEEPF
jgi:hypothetical protein